MGMFDYIEYKDVCEKCGKEITSFQSKAGECLLERLQPEDVAWFRGYCTCGHVQEYQMYKPPVITRVEVITKEGREFVKYTEGSFRLSYQDDGRTLKIFEVSDGM